MKIGDRVRVIALAPHTNIQEQLYRVGYVKHIIPKQDTYDRQNHYYVRFDVPITQEISEIRGYYYYKSQLEPEAIEDYEICLE